MSFLLSVCLPCFTNLHTLRYAPIQKYRLGNNSGCSELFPNSYFTQEGGTELSDLPLYNFTEWRIQLTTQAPAGLAAEWSHTKGRTSLPSLTACHCPVNSAHCEAQRGPGSSATKCNLQFLPLRLWVTECSLKPTQHLTAIRKKHGSSKIATSILSPGR